MKPAWLLAAIIACSRLLPVALQPTTLQAGSVECSGYVEARGYGFFSTDSATDDPGEAWITAYTTADLKRGRARVRASFRGEYISSSSLGSLSFDPADRLPRRSPLSLRELYIRLPLASAIDLQAGRFEPGWGLTDGYSPADAFYPRDATDPFREERLPVWGARVQGERGPWRIELFAALVTTPWRLPVMTGRYSPGARDEIYFNDADEAPPQRGFERLRVSWHAGDWDLAGWVRSGTRPAPLLEFELPEAEGPMTLDTTRRFARETGAGIEISKVVSAWVVRGEVSYLESPDADLGTALIWAGGGERPVRDGSFIVTVAGNARATPINKLFLFDRAVLPGFALALDQPERWGSWKIVWIGSFEPAGAILKAEIRYSLDDYWSLGLGTDLPHGSKRSAFGAVSEARRFRISARYEW